MQMIYRGSKCYIKDEKYKGRLYKSECYHNETA